MSRTHAITRWDPEAAVARLRPGLGAPDIAQTVIKRGYLLGLAA